MIFITKLLVYTIFYYLYYFLLFPKHTYYFMWRYLPIYSNYFRKNYTLFLVALVITHLIQCNTNGLGIRIQTGSGASYNKVNSVNLL